MKFKLEGVQATQWHQSGALVMKVGRERVCREY